MKRYMLFCGYYYYPGGGWEDFVGCYDTIDDAKTAAHKDRSAEWVQIVDSTTGEKVYDV